MTNAFEDEYILYLNGVPMEQNLLALQRRASNEADEPQKRHRNQTVRARIRRLRSFPLSHIHPYADRHFGFTSNSDLSVNEYMIEPSNSEEREKTKSQQRAINENRFEYQG